MQWPLTEIPPNLNYHQLDGTLRDTSDVISALMPSLFTFDAASIATPNKLYVESAELTAQQPQQVVTYKFNPKAVWSDGTPITVADVEAQWKANSGTNAAFKNSSANGYEQIESVAKGADEREAIVTFKQAYVDWKGMFSPLYPASTNNDPKVYNEGWVGKIPTTAGPFKSGGIDETAKTLTIVRDDKWWGDRAKLDRIVFRSIPSDAHVDALLNGEVDFIDIGPDVNKLQRARRRPRTSIHKAGGPELPPHYGQRDDEVLKDQKVRRALAMAIDRDVIAKTLLGPLGVDAKPLQNHLFMANQKGYKDNAGVLSSPDVEGAKKLLDEAGWTVQGGDVRKKDGKELAIRFVIPTQVASSQQESSLIFNMLKAVNVKVNIDAVPSDDFFKEFINKGNFDFTVFSWIGTPFPVSSSKSIYALPKGDDIQQNYARIGRPSSTPSSTGPPASSTSRRASTSATRSTPPSGTRSTRSRCTSGRRSSPRSRTWPTSGPSASPLCPATRTSASRSRALGGSPPKRRLASKAGSPPELPALCPCRGATRSVVFGGSSGGGAPRVAQSGRRTPPGSRCASPPNPGGGRRRG